MDFFGGLQLGLTSNLSVFLAKVFALVIVLYIYYISKAIIAYNLGDKSTRIKEAITFNIFKALEPVGLILFFVMNCGWAKPINISYLYMKDRKKATYLIHILPNVIIFLVGVLLVTTVNILGGVLPVGFKVHYFTFVTQYVFYSCTYIILNLIPVAPFDMYSVLTKVGKPNTRMYLSNNEKIFQMVFIFILFFGILNVLIIPFSTFFVNLMLKLAI